MGIIISPFYLLHRVFFFFFRLISQCLQTTLSSFDKIQSIIIYDNNNSVLDLWAFFHPRIPKYFTTGIVTLQRVTVWCLALLEETDGNKKSGFSLESN